MGETQHLNCNYFMDTTVSPLLLKKAFLILRRNYGCPGLDGISIKDIKRNYSYHEQLVINMITTQNLSSPDSYTKKIITDYRGNQREIYVYSVYSRWSQQYIKLLIESVINTRLNDYVFGYRRGVNEHDAYNQIIRLNRGSVMYLDIKNYYNSINIQILEQTLISLNIEKELLTIVMKAIYTEQSILPAGNVLSPALSNVYLHPFDKCFQTGYLRFGDDMFFFDYESEEEREELLSKIIRKLDDLHLSLNSKKTHIINNPNENTIRRL